MHVYVFVSVSVCRCVCACLRARVDRDLFASGRTWCIRVPACTAAVSSSSKPSSTASMSIKVMSGRNMVCYICCPPLQAQPHTYIHQVFHLVVRTQGGGLCSLSLFLFLDILKTVADAVNNSKIRGNNTVVDALTLLFNYVFMNEVWSTGVIFPLYKHGSRLDPDNYRPITLLSVAFGHFL